MATKRPRITPGTVSYTHLDVYKRQAQGRTVNFENTVICMTSNAGSSDKVGETGFGKTQAEMSRNKAMKALSDFLRPEFLSRVDEVVVFSPLGEQELRQIAALMLGEYKRCV